MILGVCEWLEGKIGIEAKILRIIFVVALLLAGTGLGIYLILWIIKLVQGE
ncbi:MAG: PspC domain-containing protein [Bacteroidetes bacterium]|nr:PspC domain-containing protein [Bacteroidota bacterium]